MKKLLIHSTNNRIYFPIINKLASINEKCITGSLHNILFDTYHQHKPDLLMLPLEEYTQEFHDFISALHEKIDIVIFCDNIQNELIPQFIQNKIKIIQKNSETVLDTVLSYDKLYNEDIYKNLNLKRNDKTLVMLSEDQEKNNSILENVLYPKTKHKLCLINNHSFEHPQNIGVCNDNDTAYLLNTFGSFVDITNNFHLEAHACGINVLDDSDLLVNLEDHKYINSSYSLQEYTVDTFVNQKLLPFIGA